ncbi:uncharacterized protein N7525_001767 [Penicillium rubens]|uniref:uncharacterized protein n=1 Tax=Penicillium rubens TaxID=1108849 RepID=UPI002A59BF7A|nr:uncharacterized protein N7525_001767 [Penicillium rubens]KAJ5844026.1 hypothetical protein N7525_001767 [Penicillium rubens]
MPRPPGPDMASALLPTTRYLMVMNKNTQMELTAYTDKHKLPYYDKIEFDEHGWLVTPPGEHRLSDDGRWSLLLTRKR